MDPSKFVLKDTYWVYYDSTHVDLNRNAHQKIVESRPKVTSTQPMVVAPLAAHQAFPLVRNAILGESMLLRTIHIGLVSYAVSILKQDCLYAKMAEEWTFKSTTGIFARAVHLITLILHQFDSNEHSDVTVSSESEEFVRQQKCLRIRNRQELADYMISSPVIITYGQILRLGLRQRHHGARLHLRVLIKILRAKRDRLRVYNHMGSFTGTLAEESRIFRPCCLCCWISRAACLRQLATAKLIINIGWRGYWTSAKRSHQHVKSLSQLRQRRARRRHMPREWRKRNAKRGNEL